MSEIIPTILAIIIGTYLYITGPIYDKFLTIDNYRENHVRVSTNSFQKEIRKNGYIDVETYHKFLKELARTGKMYTVELTHKSKLVYPDQESGYKVVFVDNNNNQIFREFDNGKRYVMKYGDDFKVTVTEKERANSRVLLSALKGYKLGEYLTFTSGGMVENEVN